MTGAILLGLILMVGGALLEWFSLARAEPEERVTVKDVLLFRAFTADGEFTRTSRVVQALGTVLLIIGMLALFL